MRRPVGVKRKLSPLSPEACGPLALANRQALCVPLAGDPQGGGSPLVGGAGARCLSALLAGGQRASPAWGEPARPGFPPQGETGKGAFLFLAALGEYAASDPVVRSARLPSALSVSLLLLGAFSGPSSICLGAAYSVANLPCSVPTTPVPPRPRSHPGHRPLGSSYHFIALLLPPCCAATAHTRCHRATADAATPPACAPPPPPLVS